MQSGYPWNQSEEQKLCYVGYISDVYLWRWLTPCHEVRNSQTRVCGVLYWSRRQCLWSSPVSDGREVSDGVDHRFDALPRLDARLKDLTGRQQEAVLTAVTQLDRVHVRDAGHTGRPVAGVARRTIYNVHRISGAASRHTTPLSTSTGMRATPAAQSRELPDERSAIVCIISGASWVKKWGGRRGKSCNYPTNGCKFPTKHILGVYIFNFVPKFRQNCRFIAPNFVFWKTKFRQEKNLPTG